MVSPKRSAFTLIELLVVIAIIAILAVVVVLTLNPAQLLAQSRDATRVSDMATLNTAIGLYQTDQGGAPYIGTSTVIYISLTDTTSSCTNLGLPTPPTGYIYDCSTSTSSRLANGQGWISLNFSLISSGSPLGSLPLDPTNTSSSGLYYTYTTNGNQYQILAVMESQKYKQSVMGPLGNGIDVVGSNVGSAPVGWWGMDEGVGSATQDVSGNGNNGTWHGTATGIAGTYYSSGKVGSYAGAFDGTSTYISAGMINIPLGSAARSQFAWINMNPAGVGKNNMIFGYGGCSANTISSLQVDSNNKLQLVLGAASLETSIVVATSSWHLVGFTYLAGTNTATVYYDGISALVTDPYGALATAITLLPIPNAIGTISSPSSGIGCANFWFNGFIDDYRIYNRALSPAEFQAIYNAEK